MTSSASPGEPHRATARADDPNNLQPIHDFRAAVKALGQDPDDAVRRAITVADETPDDVVDLGALYLRVLGEIAGARSEVLSKLDRLRVQRDAVLAELDTWRNGNHDLAGSHLALAKIARALGVSE